MRGRLLVLGALTAALALPATAAAVGIGTLDSIRLPDAASHIAAGPDGSVFVTLTATRQVAKVAPDGTVTTSADLGGAASGIAVADGKVWATVTSLKKVAAFDPANLDSVTFTNTPANRCGPVAVAGLGDGSVYVSLPNDGTGATCSPATPSSLLPITAASGAAGLWVDDRGQAFDLLASGGALWVPDFGGDRVRRLAPGAALTVTASFDVPAGAQPQGIGLAPDGQIVVSLWGTGSAARVAPDAASGTMMQTFASQLPSPAGVTSVGGSLYIAATRSAAGRRRCAGSHPTVRSCPRSRRSPAPPRGARCRAPTAPCSSRISTMRA